MSKLQEILEAIQAGDLTQGEIGVLKMKLKHFEDQLINFDSAIFEFYRDLCNEYLVGRD